MVGTVFWPAGQPADPELILHDLRCQLNPADHDRSSPKTLQSRHGAEPLLYAPVILFDGVVQVFAGANPDSFRNFAGSIQISHSAV
jgi:hypothetical protein